MGEFIASRLSLGQAHTAAARLLREARIAAPELDARLLLCHAAGLSHEAYVAGSTMFSRLMPRQVRCLCGAAPSRRAGVAHYQDREFMAARSASMRARSIRDPMQTLIEAALGLVDREAPLNILDLGTGSGCILVTQLAELASCDRHRNRQKPGGA
jgi:methylase of polypeptide subunit release factors